MATTTHLLTHDKSRHCNFLPPVNSSVLQKNIIPTIHRKGEVRSNYKDVLSVAIHMDNNRLLPWKSDGRDKKINAGSSLTHDVISFHFAAGSLAKLLILVLFKDTS
jgi:hypothetical protein